MVALSILGLGAFFQTLTPRNGTKAQCHCCVCAAVLTGSPGSADPLLEAIIQEKLKGISKEASDRNDKSRKYKQLLMVST